MRWRLASILVMAGAAAALLCGRAAPKEPPAPPARFDRDVQPILNRCVQCHGPSKARGGLRLDSREGAIAATDSGVKAIVPGRPEQSELLRRVSADGQDRMPPKGQRLTARQVETLRRWIAAGAEWPAHWSYRPLTRPAVPLQKPGFSKKPGFSEKPGFSGWPRTLIDHFILAGLAERGLSPAPPADRRTLLRRVYFDLIGLPPTAEEIDAALNDKSPDWYEKVVDRLLASPHYGERWARHWMDVVHFAETHGHDQDRPRDNAWPYRDYLIRALNADTPYARFVQEQVAGDVLFPGDPWATVATGLLAAGPWDESSLRDIREDSIDRQIGRYLDRDDIVTTVMATFVSTTVHCARCHDHKFDPVSQPEYYALQAVFAGTDKANRPYDLDPKLAARRKELAQRRARLEQQKQNADPALLDAKVQAEVAEWEKEAAKLARRWHVLEPAELKSAEGATLTRQPDGSVLSEGKRPDKDVYTVVAQTDLPTVTGVRLEVLTDDRLPMKGPGRQENGNLHLNEFKIAAAPRVEPSGGLRPPLAGPPLAWKGAKADFDQQGWTIAHAIDGNAATAWGIFPQVGKPHRADFTLKEPIRHPRGTTLTFRLEQTHGRGHLIGRFRLSVTDAAKPEDADALPQPVAAILRTAPAERTDKQCAELAAYYLGQKLDRELAALPLPQMVYCGTSTFAPDGSFKPAGSPRTVHVLKRGDIKTPGPEAKPGTLSCLPGLESRFRLPNEKDEGARRAALARWLSDPRNGLAWRSIANRVWQYHFGRGLVDTPNDFGRMGSPPTHPELLDWLACELRGESGAKGDPGVSAPGGSLKCLHRLIVTSAVYRQSSRHHPRYADIDADNRYLWRMNRQRLDAECIRDAALRASGQLDPKMGGPSVKLFIQTPGIHVTPNVDYDKFNVDDPANRRRSVYRFLFRTLPDPFMEALDCPDGSQLTPKRSASVTAVQALSLLNDKFMVRQSQHLADRAAAAGPDVEKQVAAAYRLILGRPPTAKEAKAVGAYAAKHGLANACRLLLNSNEFVFVD